MFAQLNRIAIILLGGYISWYGMENQAQALLDGSSWQAYTAQRTRQLEKNSLDELATVTRDTWPATQRQWRSELQEMLGLSPWPEKTDLKTTVTGTISLAGVDVDRLHYQSRPGLYVAANLYQPTGSAPADGWPAVLYVCGHARATEHGRLLGNKTAYQHHGLWLARHGVVCLMIDTIQLGEFHGEHHGTYKLGRWDWISRGYTPAGVEAWNAMRGVDLLCETPGVDGKRIGITGRSGGGAYSWFAAALDERIGVAVPVAGITDLRNHVVDGCVEGHCDCMYFVNYFGWDYAKLAALVAPRPLLLANSDTDGIFPLDGVMRIHSQLDTLYDRLGAAEKYGVLITPGPHKDTQELQVGAFKWLLKHLQPGVEPFIDSAATKEIDAARLVAFESEIPPDEQVTSVASWFVPTGGSAAQAAGSSETWQTNWLPELQRINSVPSRIAVDEFHSQASGNGELGAWELFTTADDAIQLLRVGPHEAASPIVHIVADGPRWNAENLAEETPEIASALKAFPERTHYFLRWRGATWLGDATSVKQAHMIVRRLYLLGETPDTIMLGDLLTGIQWIATQPAVNSVELYGSGRHAALTILAALLANDYQEQNEEKIVTKLHIANPNRDPQLAPVLPGILRVLDYGSLYALASQMIEIHEQEHAHAESPSQLVDTSAEPQQATGMRIVEVTQHSARVWMRATRWPLPNLGDLPKIEFEKPAKKGKKNELPILPESGADGLRHAVPGVEAYMRAAILKEGKWAYSDWQAVQFATDYSALVDFDGLAPGTTYEVRTQTRNLIDEEVTSSLSGRFKTLPTLESTGTSVSDFKLSVGTCQSFDDRDGPHGFDVYRTMLQRQTDAFVMAGDVVYYDALARDIPTAYYHWQRTYSLPTLLEFHKRVPTYFLKDDHDTYVDDSWPGTSHGWTGAFTFEDGQRIFKQQTGLPERGYRTMRITPDLQVWLMEGRDYRSPNIAADGPTKSIWGKEQKEWLKQTLDASTAKFRVIISPTPLVGPDRDNKHDNHSNPDFATEGREVRAMLASYPNTVSVCGDRHWQFHSVDPESGLHEFSVGPVSERHAGGWKQSDFRPDIHQFLRVAGGYLEIELRGAADARELNFRLLDTAGNEQHRYTLR
ncbi:MAG: alkaline phosphatase D family protein [Pirellulaceae bacterium]